MAAPPLSPGAPSCIMRLVPGIAKYNLFATGMLVGDKPPGAYSCSSTVCLCFSVSASVSGKWNGHAAKCTAAAQIAILLFCKSPLFVGDLAGGEVSSAVRCPRILSQICKPQICKTNRFGKFLPMHVCNSFNKTL